MWEARDPRSIIEAAEKAAADRDHASAERLLREAARLQEESLGPVHPDLAHTLNNLGVVCEMTGKPIEAEQCFRRAVSIAATSLDPEHPFVITSRKNLHDFCEARGKQDELESKKFFTRVALGALGPISMLMVILAAGLPRLSSPPEAASLPPVATDSPQGVAPAPAPVSVDEPLVPTRPEVVKASLCADLDEWHCDPADHPVPAGPLFFLTQVTATSDTMVQHRWYRGDQLNHSVELRIQANPGVGYRTYSRNVMNDESAGSWRVEIRSEDGALLHEERFTVR